MRFILIGFFFFTIRIANAQMNDTIILLGQIKESELKSYSWFEKHYDNYNPVTSTLDSIQSNLKDIHFKVVLGTWCSDSREQVPALIKLFETLKINKESIEWIGVDKKKKCPTPDIRKLKVEYVPTVFVYRKKKLIGKIVEQPEATLELDLLRILLD